MVYLWGPMKTRGRFLIAVFAAYLVSAWTCPAYSSSMPAHSAKVPALLEMTGHEHHHTSEMSSPLGGPTLTAIHSGCCEHCGDARQRLALAEKPISVLKSSAMVSSLMTPRSYEGFALPHTGFGSPPFLEDTTPLARSVSPLRI